MPQPNPKPPLDFATKSTRRGAVGGAGMRFAIPAGASDEVRKIIADLQATAQEAWSAHEVSEREREELAARVEAAERQLAEWRGKEEEFRKQFTDVGTILRERDTALEAAQQAELRAHEVEPGQNPFELQY